MKKKPSVLQFPNPKAVTQLDDRNWHNGGDIEIGFYARSLHKAAKTLIASLDLQPNPRGLLGLTARERSTPFNRTILESVATNQPAHCSEGNDAKSSWQQWIHQPQRLWLYSVLFNVHYMVGVVLGVYIGLMSLTGAILVYRDELSAWIPVEWLVKLHSNLLAGTVGRSVNGCGATCLTVLCLTGAFIWWPGIKNWRRGLAVSWKSNFGESNGIFTAHSDSGAFPSSSFGRSPGSISPSQAYSMRCSRQIPLPCYGCPICTLVDSIWPRKRFGVLWAWYQPFSLSPAFSSVAEGSSFISYRTRIFNDAGFRLSGNRAVADRL